MSEVKRRGENKVPLISIWDVDKTYSMFVAVAMIISGVVHDTIFKTSARNYRPAYNNALIPNYKQPQKLLIRLS